MKEVLYAIQSGKTRRKKTLEDYFKRNWQSCGKLNYQKERGTVSPCPTGRNAWLGRHLEQIKNRQTIIFQELVPAAANASNRSGRQPNILLRRRKA